MQITIRQAEIADVDQIRFLFRDTVSYVNASDYQREEINVWASSYQNAEYWKGIIKDQYFLTATTQDVIVGFASITDNGYLDFLYVHKDFQRKGIAKKLLFEIECHAQKVSLKEIFSHVSKTAIPFFEANGFIKTGQIIKKVQNIEFVNSIMRKAI